MNHPFLKLFAACVAFSISTAKAEPGYDRDESSVRELCRRAVGGAFLKAHNDADVADRYAFMIQESLSKTQKNTKATEIELKKIITDLQRTDFDVTLSEQRTETQAKLRTLQERESEYKTLQEQAKVRQAQAHAKKNALVRSIDGVFTVVKMDNGTREGYPFRVEYLTPCPKYRYVCPLPPRQSKQLKELALEGGKTPDACQRYSQVATH